MTRWFTSDLHFGHANIIRYSDRPFASVDHMNRALIQRWNEVVADADEVWCLGDMAMGQLDHTLPLIAELTGRKILVAGNHDRCWAGHTGRAAERVPSWIDRYERAGFDEILQGTIEMEVGGRRVLASHFPYVGDSHDADRFVEHRPADDGETWLLHGHVHEKWQRADRMINVGVDVWDYRPVAEETLAALMDLPTS